MSKLTRRKFIARTGTGLAAFQATSTSPGRSTPAAAGPARKFYAILSLGRIGFNGTFDQSVELARNLKFGAAGLPVEFRKDEAAFSQDLKKLPAAAKALERAGVWRVSTWVLPSSNNLTYLQNFRTHACRLRECARVLADHGQRLGLEYVAPRTFWRGERHPFVHTLSEMKELLVAIGTNNLGIQLDSWHWYNAEETASDLRTLRGSDVMTVDLNDAPRLPLDQQADDRRELPASTGVIPVKEFLGALVEIGYDGPIQAEPFNARLRSLPLEQAVASTAEAVRKAFEEAGLT